MTDVYVAAGSNVNPLTNLRTALEYLSGYYAPLRLSTAYRNKAVGFEGDPFINLVLGFSTDDDITQVIARLQEAEAACGRPRNAPKWEPRAMDLDLLLYGDSVVNEPGLKLPRADLLKRPYMLQPMAELAPQLKHPLLGKTMNEIWEEFNRHSDETHVMAPVELNDDK